LQLTDRIVGQLPGGEDEEEFRFDAASTPTLPSSISTDQVVVSWGRHGYDDYWLADAVNLWADHRMMRALGVVVLATLFTPADSDIEVRLTHPGSRVRTLRLRPPGAELTDAGLRVSALSYDYSPGHLGKHPWLNEHVDPRHLPGLHLTNYTENAWMEADWPARDTLVVCGDQQGTARLAQLLLDAGDPEQPGSEYVLEGEAGFRGVAPCSAELTLWLPGSIDWPPPPGN
jgi:hypothetical protein